MSMPYQVELSSSRTSLAQFWDQSGLGQPRLWVAREDDDVFAPVGVPRSSPPRQLADEDGKSHKEDQQDNGAKW